MKNNRKKNFISPNTPTHQSQFTACHCLFSFQNSSSYPDYIYQKERAVRTEKFRPVHFLHLTHLQYVQCFFLHTILILLPFPFLSFYSALQYFSFYPVTASPKISCYCKETFCSFLFDPCQICLSTIFLIVNIQFTALK